MIGNETIKGGWVKRNRFGNKKENKKSRGSTYLLYLQYFFM